MKNNPNILICPLEWGLGHAARMIPLVLRLSEMNCNTIIGTGREHQAFFRTEIPDIRCIDFPGFRPRYSAFLPQYIFLILQTPILAFHIIYEHFRLRKIIRTNDIDIVISDNRFGLWNKKVRTVYVTHQLRIPFPKTFRKLEFIGIFFHRAVIRRFSYCFIPDLPGAVNLSGNLSHGISLPSNAMYIGILSRFSGLIPGSEESPVSAPYNTLILSGPEPQRSILKKKLEAILRYREPKTIILGGKPATDTLPQQSGNIIYYDHLPAMAMLKIIAGSNIIIARSGYTSIMELISLGRNALLIPTPGQTEQEYLASRLQETGWSARLLQKDINDIFPDVPGQKIPSNDIIQESRLLLNEALEKLFRR